MLYQQIPALFYSLAPRFKDKQSVRITRSQYQQLNELVLDYCHTHDEPRLRGLIKRIQRRMRDQADHHIWQTEFDFIKEHLMRAMKESRYCRVEDNPDSVLLVLNRDSQGELPHRHRSRESDQMMFSNSMKKMFDRWLH